MKRLSKLSKLHTVAAAIAVVLALYAVVVIAIEALARHLRAIHATHARGISLRLAVRIQLDNVRTWLREGVGYWNAFCVGHRRFAMIAGGMGLYVKPSDIATLLERIGAVSQGAGTVTTGYFDMANFESLLAIIKTGVLGASATVDAKLQQATSSGGANVKDVPNSSITQLVKASNDNNEVLINCQDEDLDSAGGFRYVRLSITVGTAASLIDATVLGFGGRFQPAAHKATMVQAIVAG